MLLEFIEIISQNTFACSPLSASCSDPEDFFRRTLYHPPETLLDENGHVTAFDNDLLIRYSDTIKVLDTGLEVYLKAGLSFYIPFTEKI